MANYYSGTQYGHIGMIVFDFILSQVINQLLFMVISKIFSVLRLGSGELHNLHCFNLQEPQVEQLSVSY